VDAGHAGAPAGAVLVARRRFLQWLRGQGWYSGAHLAAAGDLVVVTVNYRLGALGFLHLPDSGLGAGNFGLLDQIAALRWVHENIAEFGGDPDQVTAAGQSAGALCALAMMSAPPSRDLFRRAILQSTPTGAPPTPAATASEVAEEFLHILGLRPDQAHRLRELPVGTLLAAQQNLARRRARPLRLEPPFQLVRGQAELDVVDGIPEEYFQWNGTYQMTPEQRTEWEDGVKSLYDGMVRVVVKPTWAN
jgi:para-nitrobenzyl esterase